MFENVTTEIVCDLEAIFTKHSSTLQLKVQREKMWCYYRIVWSSVSFKQKWLNVLQMIPGSKPAPIFYQYLIDNIFRQLIKIKFPTNATVQPANQYSVDLTFEEESGLRYIAGYYVCRALKKKFAADFELVECIDELVKDESDEGPDSTSKWTQLASRDGLVHINDSTYWVFHAMELVVRQRFQKGSITTLTTETKNEVVHGSHCR